MTWGKVGAGAGSGLEEAKGREKRCWGGSHLEEQGASGGLESRRVPASHSSELS